VVALVLHAGVGLVHLFGTMRFGDFRIPSPLPVQAGAFWFLLAAAVLFAAHGAQRLWMRRAAFLALLLAGCVPAIPRPIERPRNALLVEAIDVGQGDSLLLITPDGKTLLVDAGGVGGGPRQAPQEFDIGDQVVSNALWSRGIRHLDAVALSHAHSDHMGGMPAILRNFHPDELWVGDIHVSQSQEKSTRSLGALRRARIGSDQDASSATVPLGFWFLPCRTRHPFAVSGSREPSQKIEFVFSASPETIRREPRELELLRPVANQRDLAVCASMNPDF
jgi:hypothetical protein